MRWQAGAALVGAALILVALVQAYKRWQQRRKAQDKLEDIADVEGGLDSSSQPWAQSLRYRVGTAPPLLPGSSSSAAAHSATWPASPMHQQAAHVPKALMGRLGWSPADSGAQLPQQPQPQHYQQQYQQQHYQQQQPPQYAPAYSPAAPPAPVFSPPAPAAVAAAVVTPALAAAAPAAAALPQQLCLMHYVEAQRGAPLWRNPQALPLPASPLPAVAAAAAAAAPSPPVPPPVAPLAAAAASAAAATAEAAAAASDLAALQIPFAELQLGRVLGTGAFGTVYAGKWHGTPVAVKELLVGPSPEGQEQQQLAAVEVAAVVAEIRMLSRLRHPNVLLLMGASTRPSGNSTAAAAASGGHRLAIVTEMASGGSLWDALHSPNSNNSNSSNNSTASVQPLPWRSILHVAAEVARGMAYLHAHKEATATASGAMQAAPILHRDLKSPNILLCGPLPGAGDALPTAPLPRVVLSDFGLARIKARAAAGTLGGGGTAALTRGVGTVQWMAPEVLLNQPYTEKADVYAYGILLWELLSRQLPYGDFGSGQAGAAAAAAAEASPVAVALAVVSQGLRPTLPPWFQQQVRAGDPVAVGYYQLMAGAWDTDPSVRPAFAAALHTLDRLQELLG